MPTRRIPRNPIDRFLDELRGSVIDLVEDTIDHVSRRVPNFAEFPPGPNPIKRKAVKGKGKAARPARVRPEPVGPTHYDTLEVSPHASPETITAAFRSLSSRFHPDRVPGKKAEDRMRAVTEAYACLKDPARRREYDRRIGD